ncbi:phospholipase D-like domain-containing protein [Paenibacillus sp. OV219]|uniref:phospholipase D-like domain-containing protein n=1 Tax=Paenibacillus sp. OV219 TaxID=1884377 RepID=UPI0008D4370B|nr:phospholipase D-like domain-containing protein [Paenibacillus sp. OV219]SEM64132.1 Excalibur calcium-binding domain-containing protein [Paenibacillus sp. OV219]
MRILKFIVPLVIALCVAAGAIYASSDSTSKVKEMDAEWAFTQANQQPDKLLISVINEAATTLDIAIYSLTKPEIVDAIKKAKKRGVAVRIITDRIQSAGKSQKEALKLLGSAGIPLKINKHSGLMHLKMTIVDGKTATTGSFNYSKSASTDNDEVLMVLRSAEVAQSFARQFQVMWEDTGAFEAITPIIAEDAVEVTGDEESGEQTSVPASHSPQDSSGAGAADVVYKSCAEVRKAGKAPLHKGDPGYNRKLDGDGDGVACEVK